MMSNEPDIINSYYELKKWIFDFLENEENTQLAFVGRCTQSGFRCSIAPRESKGDPKTDSTARPTFVMQLFPNESELRLQWLYLNKQRKGIGTGIVNELIRFCSDNNIDKLILSQVGEDNIESQRFCESFNLKDKIEKIGYYNYIIETCNP